MCGAGAAIDEDSMGATGRGMFAKGVKESPDPSRAVSRIPE